MVVYLQSPSVFRRIPYPVGRLRIFSAIFLAIFSGIALFLGSTNLEWFTPMRLTYLFYGIIIGIFLGLFETKLVLSKLSKNSETLIWQVWIANIVLFGLPLIVLIQIFGNSEFWPFITYVFPLIPAFLAVSGWYFSKFETINKVNVFVFYFGFKYWKFPSPDIDERFQRFLEDVASKDITQFWGQIGSSLGYVGYTKIFEKILMEKKDMDNAKKIKLNRIIKAMNTFRIAAIVCLLIMLISAFTIIILLLGVSSGYFQFKFNIVQFIGPASGVILFGFFTSYFILMYTFQRKMSKLFQ